VRRHPADGTAVPHQHPIPPAPARRGHLHLLDDDSAAAEARQRAVVAEDDAGIRRLLAAVLELEGWDVVEAADGAEAVERASSFRPDAVLKDVMPTRTDSTPRGSSARTRTAAVARARARAAARRR
jgi:hypothetical protein